MNRPREPLIVRPPTTLMLIIRGQWDDLTPPQQAFLMHAHNCTPPHPRAVCFEWSGVGAMGAKLRVATRLEKLGLVEYVGHGRAEDDGNGDAERPIYAITSKGRNMLRVVDQLDPSPSSGDGSEGK